MVKYRSIFYNEDKEYNSYRKLAREMPILAGLFILIFSIVIKLWIK